MKLHAMEVCLIFDVPPWLITTDVPRTRWNRIRWQWSRLLWRRHNLYDWLAEHL